MDGFSRKSLESLAEQFAIGAEKHPDLQHIMMVGGNAGLGVGGEMGLLQEPDSISDPQAFAFKLIGTGLSKRGQSIGHVVSHDLVMMKSADQGAFDRSVFFARSVIYGKSSDRSISGFDRYRQLSREAYRIVQTLKHSQLSGWNDLVGFGEAMRPDTHYWTVGLAEWAKTYRLPSVPIDQDLVRLFGGPQFVAKDDGTSEPLMFRRRGEEPEQWVMPLEIFFGPRLRMAKMPSEEATRNLICEMCLGCKTTAIRHDVFSASATALRWILSLGDDRQPRLHVDEIDSFSKVRSVTPEQVAHLLLDGCLAVSEDGVRKAFENILSVPFARKDSPAELDDIYTANVKVAAIRRPTAFMLKGPGVRVRDLEIKHCGSKGNQLVKLFDAPANLFVIQFIGRISESVIKDVHTKTMAMRAGGGEANYVIIDGQDTARLLFAYGLLPKL